MARRKNTEAPQDSLQGGAPAEAEGAVQTGVQDVAPVTAGEGANTSPAPADASDADTVRAALVTSIQGSAADPADVEPPERRMATVASAIELDGYRFGPDDPIPLIATQFEQLKGSGALVEKIWDDLTPL